MQLLCTHCPRIDVEALNHLPHGLQFGFGVRVMAVPGQCHHRYSSAIHHHTNGLVDRQAIWVCVVQALDIRIQLIPVALERIGLRTPFALVDVAFGFP